MRWPGGSGRTPIGIDADGRFINVVQLARPSGVWRIEAVASIPRKKHGSELDVGDAHRLAGVLDRQGFRGRDVVLVMPSDRVLASVVELAAGTAETSNVATARQRLASAHKCEPETLEVACWPLPRPARAREGAWTYATGCRTEQANDLIDVFEGAGMHVRAVDVASWAAVRACLPVLAESSPVACLLKLGWRVAHLVTLYGNAVVHERSLSEYGLQNLHELLGDSFGLETEVTDHLLNEMGFRGDAGNGSGPSGLLEAVQDQIGRYARAIVSEVKRSLAYATQEYGDGPADRLLLHGIGAAIPGLAEQFSSALDMPVTVVSPPDVAECAPSVSADSPGLITALGLAQHPGD
ncbi:MAG: pilus assembly protein PilM [Planctomycetota bacterium]|jgi:Tfp pilus assembly PilM family ATPase